MKNIFLLLGLSLPLGFLVGKLLRKLVFGQYEPKQLQGWHYVGAGILTLAAGSVFYPFLAIGIVIVALGIRKLAWTDEPPQSPSRPDKGSSQMVVVAVLAMTVMAPPIYGIQPI